MESSGATGRAIDPQFEAFYRRELRPMVALAVSYTGERDTGVDLAQEALLRAYRSWATVRTMDKPGAWLRRVVINLAIDRRRTLGREQDAMRRMEPPAAIEQPYLANEPFWAAVRALPDTQRAAVTLHYLEDMAVNDIADVLDISAGTVKTALFRARRSLATVLQAEQPEEVR